MLPLWGLRTKAWVWFIALSDLTPCCLHFILNSPALPVAFYLVGSGWPYNDALPEDFFKHAVPSTWTASSYMPSSCLHLHWFFVIQPEYCSIETPAAGGVWFLLRMPVSLVSECLGSLLVFGSWFHLSASADPWKQWWRHKCKKSGLCSQPSPSWGFRHLESNIVIQSFSVSVSISLPLSLFLECKEIKF